ncbi:Fungal transcriptional regulatory [Cordyceps militaris]|uniref:Fungal transcriptional regulatory n=1 Tax=Cordyceps militaris TaxID=73501 RepID=A0A2H4SA62_CORMI|nr:Fungal transcriptional regulatory [Cordyceps militaris]
MLNSCVVCRKRKIKCDRNPHSCRNCIHFGTSCVYTTVPRSELKRSATTLSHHDESSRTFTQTGLVRRRVPRSCVACQKSKAKCSGEQSCARCGKKGLTCRYAEQTSMSEPAPSRSIAATAPPSQTQQGSVPTWLGSAQLPSSHRVRALVDMYFAQVHTVRCLGFLHIPTFMDRFREDEALLADSSGLVYIMCALAAPFLYAKTVDSPESDPASGLRYHEAGRGWAASAMQRVFANFGASTVDSLAVSVLVHEHLIRTGDHTKALLLSGMVARHVQILQLNLEHDDDTLCASAGSLPSETRESRRRLFWACYLQDALIECGIDQLKLISSDDARLQLPCREEDFLRGRPCVTETLGAGTLLPSAVGARGAREAVDNLDLRAYYIRAMALRSSILRYVKHIDGDEPWDALGGSQFQRLEKRLAALERSIPHALRMSSGNIYLYKSSGRLNLYYGLHILLAQTWTDLYRVGVAGLVFPSSATARLRQDAPVEFRRRCHQTCADQATLIAGLLESLYKCHRESMIDMPYAINAQVCSSTLVTTLASARAVDEAGFLPSYTESEYRRMLRMNLVMLQHMQQYMKVDAFAESASQALKHFECIVQRQEAGLSNGKESTTEAGHPSHFSLDYILNPLGVFPIARTQARDKHIPERFASARSTVNTEPAAVSHSTQEYTGERREVTEAGSLWDWDAQLPLLESMDYPTFLDDAFLSEQGLGLGNTNGFY